MMSVTPDNSELWVTGRYRNYVHVVDTKEYKVLARIRTDLAPHGVTFPGRRVTTEPETGFLPFIL